jgi:mRNA interferase RelE/StbE
MAWTSKFDLRALKDLDDLGPSNAAKIVDFFEKLQLSNNPIARAKPLRGVFAGLWRYRIGDLRAIVTIDRGACLITVLQVGHRKNIYG